MVNNYVLKWISVFAEWAFNQDKLEGKKRVQVTNVYELVSQMLWKKNKKKKQEKIKDYFPLKSSLACLEEKLV